MIPRLRGRVGQIEDPIELKGKFGFEIQFWDVSAEIQYVEPLGPFGPFDTEKEAQDALKNTCKTLVEEFEIMTTGQTSGHYFDMKCGGLKRPWIEN